MPVNQGGKKKKKDRLQGKWQIFKLLRLELILNLSICISSSLPNENQQQNKQ